MRSFLSSALETGLCPELSVIGPREGCGRQGRYIEPGGSSGHAANAQGIGEKHSFFSSPPTMPSTAKHGWRLAGVMGAGRQERPGTVKRRTALTWTSDLLTPPSSASYSL